MRRAALVLVVGLVVASCGGGGDDSASTDQQSTTVDIAAPSTEVVVEVTPTVRAGVIEVTGTATVPNGALMVWEVSHAELLTNPDLCPLSPSGPDPCFADGTAEVTDGEYTFTVPGIAPGEVEVWVAFQMVLGTAEQPQEVIDLYGENGENMTGPDVTVIDPITRSETTANVTV